MPSRLPNLERKERFRINDTPRLRRVISRAGRNLGQNNFSKHEETLKFHLNEIVGSTKLNLAAVVF